MVLVGVMAPVEGLTSWIGTVSVYEIDTVPTIWARVGELVHCDAASLRVYLGGLPFVPGRVSIPDDLVASPWLSVAVKVRGGTSSPEAVTMKVADDKENRPVLRP